MQVRDRFRVPMTYPGSEIDVIALYQGVTEEAFRLEARQRYNVPYEDELVRDFEAGKPQPDNEEITRYEALLRALRAAGKRPYRVHVIELPLTSYLRYELDSYRGSVDAGEEIFIADRVCHPDLAELNCTETALSESAPVPAG